MFLLNHPTFIPSFTPLYLVLIWAKGFFFLSLSCFRLIQVVENMITTKKQESEYLSYAHFMTHFRSIGKKLKTTPFSHLFSIINVRSYPSIPSISIYPSTYLSLSMTIFTLFSFLSFPYLICQKW